jgi:hypothetical protein
MSRGYSQGQRGFLSLILNAEKPLTYAEIIAILLQASGVNDPTAKLRPDRERSIRRALNGLCKRGAISTLGTGRPGDPYSLRARSELQILQ